MALAVSPAPAQLYFTDPPRLLPRVLTSKHAATVTAHEETALRGTSHVQFLRPQRVLVSVDGARGRDTKPLVRWPTRQCGNVYVS